MGKLNLPDEDIRAFNLMKEPKVILAHRLVREENKVRDLELELEDASFKLEHHKEVILRLSNGDEHLILLQRVLELEAENKALEDEVNMWRRM